MQGDRTNTPLPSRTLELLDRNASHTFKVPAKCINDGDDVSFFLTSKAYADIMTFIFQLNVAMLPRKTEKEGSGVKGVKEWMLQNSDVSYPPVVQNLAKLLEDLARIIDEAPPDPGPRRFGNISFRKWYDIVRERVSDLLDRYLPAEAFAPFNNSSGEEVTAKQELEAYLIGSFGSSQRLDYGTGHELSFLAFLGCLWKLGGFPPSTDGATERAIVLGVIEPYLALIRRLILTYTLEPAGSHGVWGLDDHSFLPYILGSAQLSPAVSSPAELRLEGSLPTAPNPGDVAKAPAVERERSRNMYFSAIGFIYDVKKGPFWEHSPILFDVSGVKAGWAKINKGMIKMYNAEVLSKFPVVQHFPFGSLFAWERDPLAEEIQASVHTSSQPKTNAPTARPQPALRDPLAEPSTQTTKMPTSGTAAPWASARIPARAQGPAVPAGPNQPTRAPWASSTSLPPPGGTTTAPWARPGAAASSTTRGTVPSTRAPWADKEPRK
ncbi:Serine/threonine-protein phosphatase 2A activator 1 [Didymosphaeria variabile]|uniref:Serine/threonine-protein phosphatase 2A activator n=1 Tax=Didymosphaeria variabile TaxID=1932322 RepID=A0A9W9C839_9PLEO|nr:Serine/threonine-protein phosphatase 2A activator 1 [Didymosphaeria variabile]KAJ4349401.1 Serine/threonine-protein phosphatase 2A activator 1 [Didymosphaeria variabile]